MLTKLSTVKIGATSILGKSPNSVVCTRRHGRLALRSELLSRNSIEFRLVLFHDGLAVRWQQCCCCYSQWPCRRNLVGVLGHAVSINLDDRGDYFGVECRSTCRETMP